MNWSRRKTVILLVLSALLFSAVSFFASYGWWVSKRRTVVLPELNGREVAWALAELERLGVRGKVVTQEWSEQSAAGLVLEQLPYAGRRVRLGRTVRLTVSLGAKPADPLEIYGLESAQAQQMLRNRGLRLQPPLFACSELPQGMALAFHEVQSGQTRRAHLVLSSGSCSRWWLMPDLQGNFFDAVARQLQSLQIPYLKYEVRGAGRRWQNVAASEAPVLEQQPPAGALTEAAFGALPVRLAVPFSDAVANAVSLRLYFVGWRAPYGFSKRSGRIRSYLPGPQATEIGFEAMPGQQYNRIVPSLTDLPPELWLDDKPNEGIPWYR